MNSIIDLLRLRTIIYMGMLFLFIPGITQPLLAQQGIGIDSIHVFQFEKRFFHSYPVDRAAISPETIGESKYGTLNNTISNEFDNFFNPDTTILHRVSDFFDPLDYPFSAAVKLHLQIGDTLVDKCSGIMISDYWLATASHCAEIRETHHNNWSPDSISTIVASPAFHNGKAQPSIGTINAEIAIFFSGSSLISYPDIIFLRLSHPVGRLTGTVGLRTTAEQDIAQGQITLTFGYPGRYLNYVQTPMNMRISTTPIPCFSLKML